MSVGGKKTCIYYDTCASTMNCQGCGGYKKAKRGIWKPVHGVLTPGGDPAYECPFCGGGRHVYGIESSHPLTKCPNCLARLKYR